MWALRRASPALVTAAAAKLHSDRRGRRELSAPSRCESLQAAAQLILRDSVQYAELNGLLYGLKDPGADQSAATQTPVAMLPFCIPEKAFQDCVALSPLWNKLVDAVARDVKWLHATLETVAKADPFTGRLLKISKQIHEEGLRQPLMLGIHRSDYMLHSGAEPRCLQVELNTIASSMGCHAFHVEKLHRFVLGRFQEGAVGRAIRGHYGDLKGDDLTKRLPRNVTLEAIPAALSRAQAVYKAQTKGAKDPVVLFVVNDDGRNFADWCFLEYALWEVHNVRVLKKSLKEVAEKASMDKEGRLWLEEEEVAVSYFRAGYGPEDYPSEVEWGARLLLERSAAVKCPSVDYQLVGAKKVQQALARPGAVERFLGPDSAKLRGCFAGLWGLGPGEDDQAIVKLACEQPEGFVLKPQREGGGHNFYGKDVAVKLKELSPQERSAYILMQRILPGLQESVMTRQGQLKVMECLSEFGFYSVYLGDGRTAHLSAHAGHLVRTKAQGVDEGGVAAGYAVISSPFLTS